MSKIVFIMNSEKIFYKLSLMFKNLGDFTLYVLKILKFIFKGKVYFSNVAEQFIALGVKSLFIATFTAIFVSMVLVLQTGLQLEKFGAKLSVAGISAIALFREMIPVIVALIVGAKIASSITAEIGTMKVSEQLDAMEMMAVNPFSYLIIPKVLAVSLSFPLLVLYCDVAGIVAGAVIANLSLNINLSSFFTVASNFLDYMDFLIGLFKSIIFGIIIGIIGTYYGYKTSGGAKGVGIYTTYSVITTLIIVIILDFFIGNWIVFLEKIL